MRVSVRRCAEERRAVYLFLCSEDFLYTYDGERRHRGRHRRRLFRRFLFRYVSLLCISCVLVLVEGCTALAVRWAGKARFWLLFMLMAYPFVPRFFTGMQGGGRAAARYLCGVEGGRGFRLGGIG